MRTIACGVLAALALTVPAACSSKANRQDLQPLPGVTTLPSVTTVPGASTAPTVPGSSTVPGTASPATTAAPTTAPETGPPATAAPGEGWTFGGFRDVPQLGSEHVRGSGCGADGSIGDTIPDGWWLGIVVGGTSSTLEFDLVCAYHGSDALPLIADCQAGPAASTCLDYFDKNFWPMNRNTKARTVPLANSLERGTGGELCAVGIETRPAGVTGELVWLHISGGRAVYIRQGCGGE